MSRRRAAFLLAFLALEMASISASVQAISKITSIFAASVRSTEARKIQDLRYMKTIRYLL